MNSHVSAYRKRDTEQIYERVLYQKSEKKYEQNLKNLVWSFQRIMWASKKLYRRSHAELQWRSPKENQYKQRNYNANQRGYVSWNVLLRIRPLNNITYPAASGRACSIEKCVDCCDKPVKRLTTEEKRNAVELIKQMVVWSWSTRNWELIRTWNLSFGPVWSCINKKQNIIVKAR